MPHLQVQIFQPALIQCLLQGHVLTVAKILFGLEARKPPCGATKSCSSTLRRCLTREMLNNLTSCRAACCEMALDSGLPAARLRWRRSFHGRQQKMLRREAAA